MRKIIKLFKSGNVCVTGLRGTGKDVLFGNVIVRRKEKYVSNLNYTNDYRYQELNFDKIDCGKNSYLQFLSGKINRYIYPYEKNSDIYISDVGVYLPSQYCSQLNQKFPYLPTYMALSRQVSHNNVHINVQNLNRSWDKIREQSDIYIRCKKCIVLFGILVLQTITIYEKYQSCVDRVPICRIKIPVFGDKNAKMSARLYLDKYKCTYGEIKNRFLIYFNKSKHDSFYFEKLLKKGDELL